MTKHTAGPLKIEGPAQPRIDRTPTYYSGGDYAIFATIDGKDVIIGEAYEHVESKICAPALANARLWAAAPDLLAALEEIEYGQIDISRRGLEKSCPSCQNSDGYGHGDDCLIGKALAKARGES